MTTKIFEIDGLPNFQRYGAPLTRLQRAGALLLGALITRDDVVPQRRKFGTAFLSCSWESKIALFFFTFPYPEPVPKKMCDFYWLQLRITCKSGWIAPSISMITQAGKILRQQINCVEGHSGG